jgi:hypothetical protein
MDLARNPAASSTTPRCASGSPRPPTIARARRHPASAARRRLLEAYAPLAAVVGAAAPAVSPIDAPAVALLTPTSPRRLLPRRCALDGPRHRRDLGRGSTSAPPTAAARRRRRVSSSTRSSSRSARPHEDLLRDALEQAFSADDKDDRDTGKFVAITSPLGFDDDSADEKTKQRPLRPKKTSG